MKRLTLLFTTVALLAISNRTMASNSDDMFSIEQRMYNSLLVGAPSSAQVESLLKTVDSRGSFNGIDYHDEEFNSGDKKRRHLQNLLRLTKAHEDPTSRYYHSEELYRTIESLLSFWLSSDIDDDNWWHRSIGFPKDLMPSIVLMKSSLQQNNPQLYNDLVEYLAYSWDETPPRLRQGANGTDISKITFARAVLSRNDELMTSVMAFVDSLIFIAQGGIEEGIYPDYSFSQHSANGRQLYLGTYGREFLDGVLFFMEYTDSTKFAISLQKITMIENLICDGVAWMWYKNTLDANQLGRKIYDKENFAPSFVTVVKRIIALNTPQRDRLEEVLELMEGKRELIGNKAYPYHDYMIHRGRGYMSSIRMTSTRTVGNEAGNGQGLEHYHTGDGATYFKVDGDEYSRIFSAWNWRFIPGVTVVADDKPMPQPMWGKGGNGGDSFAGVASNGDEGCAGFIFAKDELRAHKAWFNLSGVTIALGAAITTEREDAEVVTILNQTALKGDVSESDNGIWHNKIGYRSLVDHKIEVSKDEQKGILMLSINHKIAPQNELYAYAVYPNIELSQFESQPNVFEILSNSAQSQAIVSRESGVVMVVAYEACQVSLNKKTTIEISAPSLIILTPKRDGGYDIIAQSPYCDQAPEDEKISVSVSQGKKVVAKN